MTYVVRTLTRVLCRTETEKDAIAITKAMNKSFPALRLFYWDEEETEED